MNRRTANMERLARICRNRGWRLELDHADLTATSRDRKSTIAFVQHTPADRRRKPIPLEIAADMLLNQIAERDRFTRRRRRSTP